MAIMDPQHPDTLWPASGKVCGAVCGETHTDTHSLVVHGGLLHCVWPLFCHHLVTGQTPMVWSNTSHNSPEFPQHSTWWRADNKNKSGGLSSRGLAKPGAVPAHRCGLTLEGSARMCKPSATAARWQRLQRVLPCFIYSEKNAFRLIKPKCRILSKPALKSYLNKLNG